MHTRMKIKYDSTSPKPVMTKLENLFGALVNIEIFQVTLKFCLFTVGFLCNFCYNIVSKFFCMQSVSDVCSVFIYTFPGLHH